MLYAQRCLVVRTSEDSRCLGFNFPAEEKCYSYICGFLLVFLCKIFCFLKGGGGKVPNQKILEHKKKVVDELSKRLSKSCAGVLVDYKGIKVDDDTKLRRELRESGIYYSVVKNTILLRSLKKANIDGLDTFLEGTTAIAISDKDHILAAKILSEFSEDKEFFIIKSGFIDKKVVDRKVVLSIAKLPPKEVLVSMVISGLNAPIYGFVSVLSSVLRSLVIVLDAIVEKQNEK
jgi:large subunit ribosomal protein L10